MRGFCLCRAKGNKQQSEVCGDFVYAEQKEINNKAEYAKILFIPGRRK